MKNAVKVPELLWFGPKEVELDFPNNWQLEIRKMAGHDRKVLTPAQIKEAVGKPLGIPPIRTMAKGKKQVVIIFDDVQRPTRVSQVLPALLEELAAANQLSY